MLTLTHTQTTRKQSLRIFTKNCNWYSKIAFKLKDGYLLVTTTGLHDILLRSFILLTRKSSCPNVKGTPPALHNLLGPGGKRGGVKGYTCPRGIGREVQRCRVPLSWLKGGEGGTPVRVCGMWALCYSASLIHWTLGPGKSCIDNWQPVLQLAVAAPNMSLIFFSKCI